MIERDGKRHSFGQLHRDIIASNPHAVGRRPIPASLAKGRRAEHG